jgi:opacity protein-like surface antigen
VRRFVVCCVIVVLSASTARAQSWELAALAGYAPAVDLERQSRDVDGASIGGGFTFTFQAARSLTPNWSVEASFTQASSSYDLTMGNESGRLFSVDIAQLHGDVVYEFGESGRRLRPFVFGGAGATFFSARDLPSETKTSVAVGGGAKVFVSPNVGVRAQVRYRPIWLGDDEAGDFCDPFGFCQSILRRFEFAAGVSFRF